MLKIAQFISTVLNPITLLSPIAYLLVLRQTGNRELALFWEIISFIFILIVAIFILIGVEEKIFSDFDISKRKQRPLLFTFSIGLSAIYIVILYFLKAPSVLFIVSFTVILGLIIFEIVNRITKASIHVGTIAAFAASVSLVYGGVFYLTLLLIPIVAWARIRTRNHTQKQVVIGATLGLLITLVVYVIFKYIV
jgi:hypothetical protein